MRINAFSRLFGSTLSVSVLSHSPMLAYGTIGNHKEL